MLKQPTGFYGLFSVALLDFMTHEPLKIFKIAAELTIPFEADMDDLISGGLKMAEESEPKVYKSDMSLMLKQFDRELFAYLSSAQVVIGSAEPYGYSSAQSTPPTAVYSVGATNTIASATTGIATIAVDPLHYADLKAGKYIIKAVSATTIYFMPLTDVEFGGAFTAGTEVNFGTNSLGTDLAGRQIYVTGTTPFTFAVTNGAPTSITGFGLIINGGSAVAMTAGDTATIEVRPVNIENDVITLGHSAALIPKRFALYAALDTKVNGEVIEIFAPKVMPSGFAVPLKTKAWAEASPKLKMLHYTSDTEDFAVKLYRSVRQPV